MNTLRKFVFGAIALFAAMSAMSARAGGISDTGVNAYWGSDRSGCPRTG